MENELDTINDFITEGVILSSKVNWCEHGEKSSVNHTFILALFK